MTDDPRVASARYRLTKEADDGTAPDTAAPAASVPAPFRQTTERERAAYVEAAIQQAIRRGEFDDLPGAGKPIPGLGASHDPDWWIRRKIETERLTGLGPPALMLRVEHAELDARLDELTREEDVREQLDDFNRRVIEARRQLLGGPPVVTPTRDVEVELAAWRARRDARARQAEDAAQERQDAPTSRRRRRWRGGSRRR